MLCPSLDVCPPASGSSTHNLQLAARVGISDNSCFHPIALGIAMERPQLMPCDHHSLGA